MKILGVLVFIFSIIWLIKNHKIFNLENNGTLVYMKIIEKPQTCLGTRAKYNMKLDYNGEIFVKQVASSICDQYQVGDRIQMKYLRGYNQVLYPKENFTVDYGIGILFALSGVSLVIYGFVKK
jgi:hypothetical protein